MMTNRTVKITYDPISSVVYIDAPESAFVPAYLDYVLEYLKIPKAAHIEFAKEEGDSDGV
jgi:hypothetical protein